MNGNDPKICTDLIISELKEKIKELKLDGDIYISPHIYLCKCYDYLKTNSDIIITFSFSAINKDRSEEAIIKWNENEIIKASRFINKVND